MSATNLAVDPFFCRKFWWNRRNLGSVFKIKTTLSLAYRELVQNSLYLMKKQGKQVSLFSSEGAILKIINQAFQADLQNWGD